jgi:hypothetical protein
MKGKKKRNSLQLLSAWKTVGNPESRGNLAIVCYFNINQFTREWQRGCSVDCQEMSTSAQRYIEYFETNKNTITKKKIIITIINK